MNKIKKIFISLGAIIISAFTKICGLISRAALGPMQALYGPPQEQDLYGPPPLTTGETLSKIAKPIILVVIFIIGLFVILNKKITKKVKAIVIFVLIILGILGYVLLNYISESF